VAIAGAAGLLLALLSVAKAPPARFSPISASTPADDRIELAPNRNAVVEM
jgi:hypothetical protein